MLTVVSWNIRGLGDPLKCTMVSTSLRKYLPAICALQETHLIPDSLSCLKFRWVGKSYHCTHPSFSRGVSVLIHGSLDYQELDSVVDTEGYVILHCQMFSLKLYISHLRIVIRSCGRCWNFSWIIEMYLCISWVTLTVTWTPIRQTPPGCVRERHRPYKP